MSTRRIETSGVQRTSNHLTEIAERIKKLSYREMQQLGGLVAELLGHTSRADEVIDALLAAADARFDANSAAKAAKTGTPETTADFCKDYLR